MTEHLVLLDLLRHVPEGYRKILFLRYYVGLPQREVAALLGRKQQSVDRSEKAALKAIKTRLSENMKSPSLPYRARSLGQETTAS